MTNEKACTRRYFVAGVSLSLTYVASFAPHIDVSKHLQKMLTEDAGVLSLFANPESAESIGVEYLRTHPEPKSSDLLLLIDKKMSSISHNDGVSTERELIRGFIRNEIQQDFVFGRVVSLNGWILSKTEVQLCARVAMILRSDHGRIPKRMT